MVEYTYARDKARNREADEFEYRILPRTTGTKLGAFPPFCPTTAKLLDKDASRLLFFQFPLAPV